MNAYKTAGASPAPETERILALDAVRGFALFGILIVNVLGISGLRAFVVDDAGAVEPALRRLIEVFFQGKFVSLFSILFGISFFLLLKRLETKNVGIFGHYGRRIGILFLIGAGHALLQPGEVLMPYAFCGLFLVVFYKMPSKFVLVAAVLLMVAPHLHSAWITATAMEQATVEPPGGGSDLGADTDPSDDGSAAEISNLFVLDSGREREILRGRSWDAYDGPDAVRVHSGGSMSEVIAYNVGFTRNRWATSWAGYLWIVFPLPLMMIGLLVARSGVLRHVEDRKSELKLTCWCGLIIGVGLYWVSTQAFARASIAGWNPWIGFAGNLLFVISALILAMAYAAGVFLLFQRYSFRKFLAPLSAVGQMALTNYLLQTVVTVGLFWGIGLGWYGRYGTGTVEVLAVIILAAQAYFSILWLRYFRFGPVEWLWRCGTYWQLLPLKCST